MMNGTSTLKIAALAASLAVIVSGSTVLGEPSHATVAIERRAEAADAPPLAELYQSVLSFQPGAWTVVHSHSGGSYNTVVQGEVTLRIGDTDRTFGPGEGWTDEPGVLHAAGNTGSGEARLIASMVVGPGVPPATVVDPEDEASAPPPPDLLALTKTVAAVPAGPLDVVEQVIDLEAGSQVVLPAPLGPRLIGVLDGVVTVEIDGTRHTFEAGEGWSETAGASHPYTIGDAGARIAVTTLVPRTAPMAAAAGQ